MLHRENTIYKNKGSTTGVDGMVFRIHASDGAVVAKFKYSSKAIT
jgi:ribosomal protein L35AE/L33A